MEPKRFKIAGTLLRATLASVAVFAAATMPANADSAASDASTTIKIGIYPGNISSTPWIVADEKGFFAEQGLKADIINFNNGPALAAGVVSGSVDVAYGASSVSFDVARQSSKLLVLNDFAEFINWQVIVIKDKATSSATAGFPENVKSLKGLKIGLPSLGGVVNKFVVALLKAGGLSTDDVTIIAVGAPNTAVPALKNGRVDALAAVVSLQDLQRQGMEGVTVVDAGIPGNAGVDDDGCSGRHRYDVPGLHGEGPGHAQQILQGNDQGGHLDEGSGQPRRCGGCPGEAGRDFQGFGPGGIARFPPGLSRLGAGIRLELSTRLDHRRGR